MPSVEPPVFQSYVPAASIMVLKLIWPLDGAMGPDAASSCPIAARKIDPDRCC
jgi:hypothetical protein